MNGRNTTVDIIDAYARVSAQAQALAQSIPDEGFAYATPCAEWDVRALCNHIYTGEIIVSTRIRGLPQPDPKSAEDRLGDDPKARISGAFTELRGLLSTRPDLDMTVYTHRDGQRHARDLGGLLSRRTADLLVHNWDLTKALGGSTADFDPDLVDWTLQHYRDRFEGFERSAPQILASVAPPRALPAGTNAADRLAGFLGRDVGFTPHLFGTRS
jgi:uncharacterized protein (TIGR03086 family)